MRSRPILMAANLLVIVLGIVSLVRVGAGDEESFLGRVQEEHAAAVGSSGTDAGQAEKATTNPQTEGLSKTGSVGQRQYLDVSGLNHGDLTMELVVEPECLTRGQAGRATLKADPGAHVSLIVSYSDGQSFGTWYAGSTDPDGSLVFPWTVPLQAAVGQGNVLVAGHVPASEKSGTVAASFRVVAGRTC